MSRRTGIYRKCRRETLAATAYALMVSHGRANGRGTWLGEGKIRGFGQLCSLPMKPEKAERLARAIHNRK